MKNCFLKPFKKSFDFSFHLTQQLPLPSRDLSPEFLPCSVTSQARSTTCSPQTSLTACSPEWSWSMPCILRVCGNHGFGLRTQRSVRLWQLTGRPTKCRCSPSSLCSGAVSPHVRGRVLQGVPLQSSPWVLPLRSRATCLLSCFLKEQGRGGQELKKNSSG